MQIKSLATKDGEIEITSSIKRLTIEVSTSAALGAVEMGNVELFLNRKDGIEQISRPMPVHNLAALMQLGSEAVVLESGSRQKQIYILNFESVPGMAYQLQANERYILKYNFDATVTNVTFYAEQAEAYSLSIPYIDSLVLNKGSKGTTVDLSSVSVVSLSTLQSLETLDLKTHSNKVVKLSKSEIEFKANEKLRKLGSISDGGAPYLNVTTHDIVVLDVDRYGSCDVDLTAASDLVIYKRNVKFM